jgi:hypothetical protein
MTQVSTTPAVGVSTSTTTTTTTLSRYAGGLALGHVVLLLGAFAVEGVASAEHGTDPTRLARVFGDAPLGRTLLAGYAEALSFFVLTAAVIVIARLFSRRTTAGRLASQCFAAFGICYIASTLAVGFPPGAAALYAAHHGVDAGSIAMVNDIRNYSFLLQVALSAAMVLALGIAALNERLHVRWIGWGGVAVGILGIVLTPIAHNAVSMVWMIWWVGMAVVLLRQNRPQE